MQDDGIRHLDRSRVPSGTNRTYLVASLITLGGNMFLALAKVIVAYLSASRAVYADAINSVTDVIFSLVMVFVLRLALQPADEGHPHGHGRLEPLVSLAIGVMMAFAGVEAVRSAVQSLLHGTVEITGRTVLFIPVITVLTKSVMYRLVKRMGDKVDSPALRATARDNLSDILSAGVVFFGVGASALGYRQADPIAALGVSVWIFRSAYDVLAESVRHLVGGSASDELYEQVRDAVLSVPGVLGIEIGRAGLNSSHRTVSRMPSSA